MSKILMYHDDVLHGHTFLINDPSWDHPAVTCAFPSQKTVMRREFLFHLLCKAKQADEQTAELPEI